jgi:glyceraldehyde 3-phosphate dehydrogenase
MKIGINGFGRIGRVLHRIISSKKDLSIVAINDINPDINNIAYLANYDSTYGSLRDKFFVKDNFLQNKSEKIKIFSESQIDKVPWQSSNVDVVVDASGVAKNLTSSLNLKKTIKNIIVTNSPDLSEVDNTVIYGVNHKDINVKDNFLIASSICDATAISPILKLLNNKFKIKKGFVTTLHPWLGYQNLLDGPSKSVAVPGEIIDNYALGRSSSMTLIPKNTSAISATYKILPELKGKFLAHSYRIPTNVVSSADLTLQFENEINLDAIDETISDFSKKNPEILSINQEALVSSDFVGSVVSGIVDKRFLSVKDDVVKIMVWYDNEWGYSSRVSDLLSYIKKIS